MTEELKPEATGCNCPETKPSLIPMINCIALGVIAISLVFASFRLVLINEEMAEANEVAKFNTQVSVEVGKLLFNANELAREAILPNYTSIYDTMPEFKK